MTDEQLETLARHAESAPPGPWAAEKRAYDWGIYANIGILLRTSRVNYTEEQEESLALLVAAAPELLAEVRRLRAVAVAACAVGGNWDPGYMGVDTYVIQALRGALAAAGYREEAQKP